MLCSCFAYAICYIHGFYNINNTEQGQEDIEATCEVLAERMETLDGAPPLLLLPMYSQLPADLQV
jgi:hypothetical protein